MCCSNLGILVDWVTDVVSCYFCCIILTAGQLSLIHDGVDSCFFFIYQ